MLQTYDITCYWLLLFIITPPGHHYKRYEKLEWSEALKDDLGDFGDIQN